jgi:DNA-directed RNA polymerase specialized sigma24 family protein
MRSEVVVHGSRTDVTLFPVHARYLVMGHGGRSDEELLAATARDPEAFGVFYRRHGVAVFRYMLFRTGSAEEAAELSAEVFAAALESSRRFKRMDTPARAWLFGIANHKLADSRRRGRIESAARAKMGVGRLGLDDAALERAEELAGLVPGPGAAEGLVADLPAGERDAVLARVVEELSYVEVAERLGITQPAARQRVRRGLARLAQWLGESKA